MNKTKLIKLMKELRFKTSEDVIPKGYLSREELCKMLGVGTTAVCLMLKRIKEKAPDKIQIKRFKIRNATGTLSSVPHYKITL